MRFGHRVHGTVAGYDEKGRGTFELSGERTANYELGKGTVTIPFTAVGDEIVATFIKREHGTKIAKVEEITKPSPDRIEARCPHAGVCGGCLWQHLSYDAQLRLKEQMVNAAFEHAGHAERVHGVMPSDDQFFYRNRMDYAVGWLGTVGLKEYGSWNRYVDITECFLLSEDVSKILETVRVLMKEFDLEPWDAKFHTGLVRYVVIREGKNTKQRMVMLVVHDPKKLTEEMRAAIRERLSPMCTSLLIGEQSLLTDLSYVQSFEVLTGSGELEEEVNGVRYRFRPNSFFQTNTRMAAKLQDAVLSAVRAGLVPAQSDAPAQSDKDQGVLDLYCGVGFFSLRIARDNPTVNVFGHELDAEAITLASQNAALNNIADRVTFTSGPAEDLSWKDIDADLVVLDPPRAGLHPRVIKTLLETKPKTIVYVSCNYHRLVEELKELKNGYRVESVQALDLFPHTPHVEVITVLKRITK